MTEDLFRQDAYLRSCEAAVTGADERGVRLDRTVFYASGGGQPGDTGRLRLADGRTFQVSNTIYGVDKADIVHVLAEDKALPDIGTGVFCEIDWDRRYRLMRMHTCLHLLSVVLPYPVTGGQVGPDEGRLDFDIPDAGLDKDEITERVNALIADNHPVRARWITDEELEANPGLVKTMSVKPPVGTGRVRLIEIGDIDLQPCGGTHVARTGEIGRVAVTRIEKKGAKNRRVRIAFA
jgi:misacylated tRNA(Ala) deacylase